LGRGVRRSALTCGWSTNRKYTLCTMLAGLTASRAFSPKWILREFDQ